MLRIPKLSDFAGELYNGNLTIRIGIMTSVYVEDRLCLLISGCSGWLTITVASGAKTSAFAGRSRLSSFRHALVAPLMPSFFLISRDSKSASPTLALKVCAGDHTNTKATVEEIGRDSMRMQRSYFSCRNNFVTRVRSCWHQIVRVL